MDHLDVVTKLTAVALCAVAFFVFVAVFDAAGLFGVIWCIGLSVFLACTGVGLWRYRGWAFLAWSVMLLLGFFWTLVDIDGEGAWLVSAGIFVLTVALIGYFGRWAVEKRFRPHLDVDTHHHHDDHGHAEPAAT